MTSWVRRIVVSCVVAFGLFLLWIGLGLFAMFTEPESNRAYAETWRRAPISELLEAQGGPPQALQRSDGVAGTVYRYHIGPWRGLKGRTYPGSSFNALFGNRYMQSGVHLYTAPTDTYCDVDFISNEAGLIEAITYSGNDCG
jgi:hypothetical protein